jgi:hypothetical protein
MPLDAEVLAFIASRLEDGAITLETGSGHSTVVFVSKSKQHVAIAPDETERDAIVDFCEQHGIDTAPLTFVVAKSADALPTMTVPPLDMVLIDGDHAFPAPFLDWYYVADAVRKGGLLLVDDVQLRTGHVLRQFLLAEHEWRHVCDLGKTTVFEKLADGAVTGKWWGAQPWGATPYAVPGAGVRQRIAVARARLRPRSRLRSALGRGR